MYKEHAHTYQVTPLTSHCHTRISYNVNEMQTLQRRHGNRIIQTCYRLTKHRAVSDKDHWLVRLYLTKNVLNLNLTTKFTSNKQNFIVNKERTISTIFLIYYFFQIQKSIATNRVCRAQKCETVWVWLPFPLYPITLRRYKRNINKNFKLINRPSPASSTWRGNVMLTMKEDGRHGNMFRIYLSIDIENNNNYLRVENENLPLVSFLKKNLMIYVIRKCSSEHHWPSSWEQ